MKTKTTHRWRVMFKDWEDRWRVCQPICESREQARELMKEVKYYTFYRKPAKIVHYKYNSKG